MQIALVMAGLVTGYLSYRMILGLKKHGAADLEVPTRLFLEDGGKWSGDAMRRSTKDMDPSEGWRIT